MSDYQDRVNRRRSEKADEYLYDAYESLREGKYHKAFSMYYDVLHKDNKYFPAVRKSLENASTNIILPDWIIIPSDLTQFMLLHKKAMTLHK